MDTRGTNLFVYMDCLERNGNVYMGGEGVVFMLSRHVAVAPNVRLIRNEMTNTMAWIGAMLTAAYLHTHTPLIGMRWFISSIVVFETHIYLGCGYVKYAIMQTLWVYVFKRHVCEI